MRKIFITGTDTNVGKTYIAVSLLKQFAQNKLSTIAIKPIASGCYWQQDQLVNADALALQQAASQHLPYQQVNPFAFEPPIAPHIAAQQISTPLSVTQLMAQCQPALSKSADIHVIEGAGGWLVPLNYHETLADFAKAIHAEIILVVGMRLGCINHALLSYHMLAQSGLKVLGWIANCIEPDMLALNDNIFTLKRWLPIPCLEIVAYHQPITIQSL